MITRFFLLMMIALTVGISGCRQPMSGPVGARSNQPIFGGAYNSQANGAFGQPGNGQSSQVAQLNQQIRELQGRVGSFDNDNSGLHTEVATLKQQLQRTGDVNAQLRQQLGDMARNVQQLQQANTQYQQQLASSRSGGVPGQLVGNATVRANNSLLGKLPEIRVDGVQTRMDGDVIRIEMPTDSVLVPGTFQINSGAQRMFSDLAAAISRNFPEKFVSIEAHWDNTPLQGGMSAHQLTASQALAVLNHMQGLGMSQQQVFMVGMSNIRPRYQGNNTRNRRIEIVIYPESYRR